MLVTPEMFCRPDDRRKHQPIGFHAALFRLQAQIAFDQFVRLEQPQNAAGNQTERTVIDGSWQNASA